MMRGMSLVYLGNSILGCDSTALDEIKKKTPIIIKVPYASLVSVCVCVCVCSCTTVNKIKVIQTDYTPHTQNSEDSSAPLFPFFLSSSAASVIVLDQ